MEERERLNFGIENGELRVENGEWRMENLKWRMELRCCSILHFFLIQGFKVDEVVKDFKVIKDSRLSILNSQFSILHSQFYLS